MKNFFKENWFKLVIIVIAFLYLLIFAYEQYAMSVSHNYQLFIYCISEASKDNPPTEQAVSRFNSCAKTLTRNHFHLPF